MDLQVDNSRDDSSARETRWRRLLRVVSPVGLALGALLVWWMLRGIDLPALGASLRAVSMGSVLIALGILFVSLPLRATQWQWLLGGTPRVTFRSALRAVCIGHLGNFVLPARGGEVVRTYLVSRDSKLPFAAILPSVALARVQDLPPILVLLLGSVHLGVLNTLNLGGGDGADTGVEVSFAVLSRRLAFVVSVAVLLLAFAYRFRREMLRAARIATRRLPGRFGRAIEHTFGEVANALDVLGNLKHFVGAQVLSFVCWTLFVLASIPLLLAFSFTLEQAVLVAVAQTAITSLTFVLPAAPGAVGTFHVLCVASVYAVVPEVPKETAVAYAVVAHLVGTLGPGLPGLMWIPFLKRPYAAPHGSAVEGSESDTAIHSDSSV